MRSQPVRITVTATAFAAAASALCGSAFANELVGFAMMPANTFADGPTAGQFAGPGAGGNALPVVDHQVVQDHQFLVIERNGVTATSTSGTPFKQIFIADIGSVPSGGFAKKTLLVDLMNISDPHDLNGDGQTLFTFPYVTIEDVLILDPTTLLVINDNNYPGTGGRDTNSDHTEFLKIRLDQRLDVARDCHGDDDDDDHGH